MVLSGIKRMIDVDICSMPEPVFIFVWLGNNLAGAQESIQGQGAGLFRAPHTIFHYL